MTSRLAQLTSRAVSPRGYLAKLAQSQAEGEKKIALMTSELAQLMSKAVRLQGYLAGLAQSQAEVEKRMALMTSKLAQLVSKAASCRGIWPSSRGLRPRWRSILL